MIVPFDPEAYVPALHGRASAERGAGQGEDRSATVKRLRDEARRLSDRLEEVNRELNLMGANDDT